MLRRDNHVVKEASSGRELLDDIGPSGARLVVIGTRLADLSPAAVVRRIRVFDATRHVSVLALLPATEGAALESEVTEAGANAVLRRPLDRELLESWISRLLAVPRRVDTRVAVQAQVVGTPHTGNTGSHFYGLTRNLSTNGMLLASPVPLESALELDLEFTLPGTTSRLKAMARIVREADIEWPYRGYGLEFILVPPGTLDAIEDLISHSDPPIDGRAPDSTHGIHSTIRRDDWVYEILQPIRRQERWQTEIRRAPRESWRPGTAGPFYVVEAGSQDAALAAARAFLTRLP